jgi:hypothetical protein
LNGFFDCFDKIGVTPDTVVILPEKYSATPTELIPQNEDTQLQAAIGWLENLPE